jgi:hypothetical protein
VSQLPDAHSPFAVQTPPLHWSCSSEALPPQPGAPLIVHGQPSVPMAPVPVFSGVHMPPQHPSPAPHAIPHALQFIGSVFRSVHSPLQFVRLAAQDTEHP